MPLPLDGSFPLTGYSKPGEATTSKPKQAMIVRLSPETLEALQALQDSADPQSMKFTFGDSPCIVINGESFPLNNGPTDKWHDIYLRSSSAGRRNVPFKLYANVVGRYAVQRQLDNVGERIREKKNEAETERANRTTIMLEAPPADVAAKPRPQKKKESSSNMFRKPVQPSAKPEPTPPPTSLPPEKVKDIRKRLIHCLASGDRTEEAAIKAVSNNPVQRLRQAILQVLDDVAVLVSKSSKTYRLKLQSWQEVKPYEMAIWSESEKKRIATEGRAKLKELRIPSSDPIWDNLTPPRPAYPDSGLKAMTPSTSTTSGSQPPSSLKRPHPDRDSEEPLAKRRERDRESDRERPLKSSGDRPKASSSRPHDREVRERERDGDRDRNRDRVRERDDVRDKDRQRERQRDKDVDRDRDQARDVKKDRVKEEARDRDRGKERGRERDKDRERDTGKLAVPSPTPGHLKRPSVSKTDSGASGSSRRNNSPLPPRDPSGLKGTVRSVQRKPRGDESNVESDFERRPRKADRDPIQRLSRKDKEDGEYSDSGASVASRTKRKVDERSSPDPREAKRQRMALGSSNLKPKVEESDSELMRPKKVRDVGSSSSMIKREHSPLVPPSRDTQRKNSPLPKRPATLPERPQQIPKRESSYVSNDSSMTGRHGSKQPRRQPIYTSSEDEGDDLPQASSSKARSTQLAAPTHKSLPVRPVSPLPPKPAHSEAPNRGQDINGRTHSVSTNAASSTSASLPAKPRPARDRKPLTKREAIDKEYTKVHSKYIKKYADLCGQKETIEARLDKMDERGAESLSDSEGDIMSPEQITKMLDECEDMRGQLQVLARKVARRAPSGGSGSSSD